MTFLGIVWVYHGLSVLGIIWLMFGMLFLTSLILSHPVRLVIAIALAILMYNMTRTGMVFCLANASFLLTLTTGKTLLFIGATSVLRDINKR